MQELFFWVEEFPAAITVADKYGKIVAMNRQARDVVFAAEGGFQLIGKSLFDCHPPAAAEKVRQLLQTGRVNVYSIEKKGIKKIIYQSPWFKNGELSGLVEISLPVPTVIPHYKRD